MVLEALGKMFFWIAWAGGSIFDILRKIKDSSSALETDSFTDHHLFLSGYLQLLLHVRREYV